MTVPPIEIRPPRHRQQLPVSRAADALNLQLSAATAIRMQRFAIIRHRVNMVRSLGRAVSLDEAARDWIPKHAADWRSAHAARSLQGAGGARPADSVAGRA